MIDAGSVSAIASSLKAAGDIAKTMIGLRDSGMLQSKTIELQSMILDAQSSAFSAQQERASLIERIGALEAEVARLKAWDTEKQRYELQKWGNGAFARVLKEGEANGEPIHALCAKCYDSGIKSILQANGHIKIYDHAWDCPTCRFSLRARSNVMDKQAPG